MPALPPPDFNQWTDQGDHWNCEFFVNEYYDSDPNKDQDCFRKHILLEFLDYLGVLEYSRGYDGIYYDITIRK